MNAKTSKSRKPTIKTSARWLLVSAFAVVFTLVVAKVWLDSPIAPQSTADIVVYKTPTCDCCNKWVEHLRDNGFEVGTVNMRSTQSKQSAIGVPHELRSCHTARIGDYWIEGHVPADLIQQLLQERPENIKGLSAPGMPVGSPGMEGPNPVEYEVMALHHDGSTSVYATRQGQSEVR